MLNRQRLGLYVRLFRAILEAEFSRWCGDYIDALKHYDSALALKGKLSQTRDAECASILLRKGRILAALRLHEEAALELTRATEIALVASEKPTLLQALCLYELSQTRTALGCRFGARRSLVQAERIIDQSGERCSIDHVAILNALISLMHGEPDAAFDQIEHLRYKVRIITRFINGPETVRRLSYGRLL